MSVFFKSYSTHIVSLCVCIFATPCNAYASADIDSPFSISLIALAVAAIFIFFVYKFKCKDHKHKTSFTVEHEKLCLFSEGKMYWQTFKPIIESLIEKNVFFFYVTMDKNDPALEIESPYMHVKCIGNGSFAHAILSNIQCNVMLSTTPNIGTEGFPVARSKNIDCLVHVFHAMGGIAAYNKHSLDSYDAVLMPGDYAEDGIRIIEQLRNLPKKECASVGLPYFDELAKKVQIKTEINTTPVILIAPSWGNKGLLKMYGTGFIHDIAQAKYEIIIRPHPQSWKMEKEFLEKIQQELKDYSNIQFDSNVDGSASLQKADLMISDKSGVRFDFALLYKRPVITIDAPILNAEQYEFDDIGAIWVDTVAHELGAVFIPQEDNSILPVIAESLQLPVQHFDTFRDMHVAHFTQSADCITDWLIVQKSKKG